MLSGVEASYTTALLKDLQAGRDPSTSVGMTIVAVSAAEPSLQLMGSLRFGRDDRRGERSRTVSSIRRDPSAAVGAFPHRLYSIPPFYLFCYSPGHITCYSPTGCPVKKVCRYHEQCSYYQCKPIIAVCKQVPKYPATPPGDDY